VKYFSTAENSKRRFARLCNRVESGVLGRNPDEFYRVVLTTREGDDNSWPTMVKHLKLLRQQLQYKGIPFEYIFAPHISDIKGLLHLDGLVWERSGALNVLQLQVLWLNIHGANQVMYKHLSRPELLEALVRYIVSHMFKDYDKIIEFKGRALVSKGWMPEGWQDVRSALVRRAVDKTPILGRGAWVLMNNMYRRWLCGERIVVEVEGVRVAFQRKDVYVKIGGEI